MALTVIEDSLGAPAAHFFTDLNADVEPIAAASLGQVYKLTRKADGATVAVKVQRCGKRAVWGIAAFMPPPTNTTTRALLHKHLQCASFGVANYGMQRWRQISHALSVTL